MTDFGRQFSRYVDRGDPATHDFNLLDLTTDGAWHELDLSPIVPTGTKAVNITFNIRDNLINQILLLRQNGNTKDKNCLLQRTQVANHLITHNGILACDANYKIAYKATNTTWTSITITIMGYFL